MKFRVARVQAFERYGREETNIRYSRQHPRNSIRNCRMRARTSALSLLKDSESHSAQSGGPTLHSNCVNNRTPSRPRDNEITTTHFRQARAMGEEDVVSRSEVQGLIKDRLRCGGITLEIEV